MTNFISGKSGKLNVGGARTDIANWKLSRTVDILDGTSFTSAGYKEKVGGLIDAKGSFRSGKFFNILDGSPIAATLSTGATATASTPEFHGSIIIAEEPVECAVEGVVAYEYTFEVTGAMTAATA